MTTAKLTELQLALLTAAAARADGNLLPLPDQSARVRKAIPSLLKRALIEEATVADPEQIWREDGESRIGLTITAAGRARLPAATPPPEVAAARPASKIALVTSLLRRDGGATLAELVEATGWLPHTTRAALTGLRKKGHDIAKGKRDDVTCYTLAAVA